MSKCLLEIFYLCCFECACILCIHTNCTHTNCTYTNLCIQAILTHCLPIHVIHEYITNPYIGNTCYLNATIQCLRPIKEFRQSLSLAEQLHPQLAVPASLSMLLRDMDASLKEVVPYGFVSAIHSRFPQFAQRGAHGVPKQQDADEFYQMLYGELKQAIGSVPPQGFSSLAGAESTMDALFGVQVQVETQCLEDEDEAPSTKVEQYHRLQCLIDKEVGELSVGLGLGFHGQLEKRSEKLVSLF